MIFPAAVLMAIPYFESFHNFKVAGYKVREQGFRKPIKRSLLGVNEHFLGEYNAAIGLYRQTLFSVQVRAPLKVSFTFDLINFRARLAFLKSPLRESAGLFAQIVRTLSIPNDRKVIF